MSIQKLYIDQQIADSPQVRLIAKRLGLAGEIVPDVQTVYDTVSTAADPVRQGKKILFLTRNKGSFIKECPGTRTYTCCGYEILHIGSFCQMDCAYCILQSYFHPPVLQYFVNHNDLFKELNSIFSGKSINRIGTGELIDRLIWELCLFRLLALRKMPSWNSKAKPPLFKTWKNWRIIEKPLHPGQ
jgi:spore photoproduct lyase